MAILSDKTVKTRKAHICFTCDRKFDKGVQMRRQVNTFDGIITIHLCMTCNDLVTKHSVLFYDEDTHMFYESCVRDVLERGETPEGLLKYLNK